MPYELGHRTTKTVEKGAHFPLGATFTPEGMNFAIYSKNATEIFLLLFDKPDGEPTDVIQLPNRDKFIWHGLVKGLRAGQLYGYKVRGEYRPEWGLRFNVTKESPAKGDRYEKGEVRTCRACVLDGNRARDSRAWCQWLR